MHTSPTGITGANVRAEMARQGITQTVLAEKLGLSQTQVSARLRGRVPFDINEITAVADMLGVPLSVLLPQQTAVAS